MEIISITVYNKENREEGNHWIPGTQQHKSLGTEAKKNLQNWQKYPEWLVIFYILSFSIALKTTDLHLFNNISFRPNLEF